MGLDAVFFQHVQERGFAGVVETEEEDFGIFVIEPEGGEGVVEPVNEEHDCDIGLISREREREMQRERDRAFGCNSIDDDNDQESMVVLLNGFCKGVCTTCFYLMILGVRTHQAGCTVAFVSSLSSQLCCKKAEDPKRRNT